MKDTIKISERDHIESLSAEIRDNATKIFAASLEGSSSLESSRFLSTELSVEHRAELCVEAAIKIHNATVERLEGKESIYEYDLEDESPYTRRK